MARHASDLCIALNACVIAVASCYATHAHALARPVKVPAALTESNRTAATVLLPPYAAVEQRPPARPAGAPFTAQDAQAADASLDADTPLSTPAGARLRPMDAANAAPALKVSPDGVVLLEAGARVRYADRQRPGVRIELSAPPGERLRLGRVEANEAVLNPYAALISGARRPNANVAVLENGRLFLRHVEPALVAVAEPARDSGQQSNPALTLARAAPLAVHSDSAQSAALPIPVANDSLDLKLAVHLVDLPGYDEFGSPVEDETPDSAAGNIDAAWRDEKSIDSTAGADDPPADDAPVAGQRPDGIALQTRRGERPEGSGNASSGPDAGAMPEYALAPDPEPAANREQEPRSPQAPGADVETGQLNAHVVYAQPLQAEDSSVLAALLILPAANGRAAQRSIGESAPRLPALRFIVDLFDDPADSETADAPHTLPAASAEPSSPHAQMLPATTRAALAREAVGIAIGDSVGEFHGTLQIAADHPGLGRLVKVRAARH